MAKSKAKKSKSKNLQKEKLKPNKSKIFLLLSLIIIFTAIVFSNTIKNDFISNWDDNVYITNSDLINDISYDGIQKMFTEYHNSNYHPLTTLSFAIQYKFSDESPNLFHIINFIFHLLNTLLVFYLIFLISKRNEVAFIVSLFFVIHPMHVESVSWIS